MMAPVKKETIKSGTTTLKETEYAYYTGTGTCGAIDWIKRYRTGTSTLTWDYTYSSSNPNYITITIYHPANRKVCPGSLPSSRTLTVIIQTVLVQPKLEF